MEEPIVQLKWHTLPLHCRETSCLEERRWCHQHTPHTDLPCLIQPLNACDIKRAIK